MNVYIIWWFSIDLPTRVRVSHVFTGDDEKAIKEFNDCVRSDWRTEGYLELWRWDVENKKPDEQLGSYSFSLAKSLAKPKL